MVGDCHPVEESIRTCCGDRSGLSVACPEAEIMEGVMGMMVGELELALRADVTKCADSSLSEDVTQTLVPSRPHD